ncbi:MAG: hypothetical protein KAJ01_05870 [Candidatus Hydrogenedentes bacterium]|nr:hypothetical protein [Candidatus Hydrogenedentota bacterium]
MAKAHPNERVLLYLKSRLWVEGCVHIPSSQGVLDYANDRDCHFIPLTDVTVFGDAEVGTVTIDFLAVNVEEIGLMTTYTGESDPVFRERIMQMVSRHPERLQDEKLESAVDDLVGWLGDDVVGRLNTCIALLGNGRSDDRITGVKLVVNQLVSDIQERTTPFGPEQEGPPAEREEPEPDSGRKLE